MSFNKVIGVDLVELTISGTRTYVVNVVCWGTGLQQLATLPGKTSKEVTEAFARTWVKPFGLPEIVITDQGSEFVGPEFTTFLSDRAVVHHFIDAQSAWQLGRTERAGGLAKEQIELVANKMGTLLEVELEIVIAEAVEPVC